MALSRARVADVPQDAVILSENQAFKHQLDTVQQWSKSSEVFALKYGTYILSAATLVTGIYFNSHYRYKFMLGAYGRIATYMPICFVPTVMAGILHTEFVLKPVLLMNYDTCPVCLELRSAAIQSAFGFALPLCLAPLGCATVAMRYQTYALPYLHESPREVLSIFRKMFRKIKTKSLYLLIAQAFLGSVVTYFEASNTINMNATFARFEQQLETIS